MMKRIALAVAFLQLASAYPALAQEQGPAEAAPIGFDELVTGANMAAVREITTNDSLSHDDPARNINLGVAYAREGRTDLAQAYFRAALASDERSELETASGEWVDSRILARDGLRRLARGELGRTELASLR